MKPIRNSAKAIIIEDDRLLTTKNQDSDGFFYILPGGGQLHQDREEGVASPQSGLST